jgi:hypothetical protein
MDTDIDTRAPTTLVEVSHDRATGLRRLNIGLGFLHLVSGSLMVLLGDLDFELPVTTFATNGPPGTPIEDGTLSQIGGIPLAWGTAAFMFLSCLFHFIVATVGFRTYIDELRHGRNRFRWVEYSLSATLMIVLIAGITGITDIAALIAIAFVNAAMILFGWLMEVANGPTAERVWWSPFWFGCVAGVGPWAAIGVALFSALALEGSDQPPTFVYAILVSIFVLFNCFAINQWLQYRRVGRWSDYIHGERVYGALSLVAKSALAWQIFANTLVG